MAQPEAKPTTPEFEPLRAGLLDPNGAGHSGVSSVQGHDPEEDVAFRGVLAIDIPRQVIARFSGTLVLNELPQRQPEVVFDRGRQFRTDDDE